MGREETQRMGRLMAAGWPILRIIAKTPWLLVLILPFLTAITYESGYRRSWFIPIIAEGLISFSAWNLKAELRLRTTQNKKLSILSINIWTKDPKYKWVMGIA